MATPAVAFLVTRLGIALVAYLSMPLIADSSVPPYHIKPDQIILDAFGSRWDTGFYLSIAEEGYKIEGVQFPSVPFFPLLPLLIRLFSLLVGDTLIAGLIVTNLALFVASILFYRLVLDEFGESVASRSVWYFLIFPTSFFGSAIYSESLFLVFAIGALYLFRRGDWLVAALFGILSTLTRFMGLLVFPLLLLEWWTQRSRCGQPNTPPQCGIFVPIVVPLGTLGYMIYLELNFGDALAFLHASAAWGRQPQSPLATILEMLRTPGEGWLSALSAGRLPMDNWIDLLFVVLFIIFGALLLKHRRWSEGVFVLLGTLIPLSTALLMSQRRYVWVLFPAFILLARWGERTGLDRLITALSLLLLGVFTAMFANWYWVG
jgi:hypothetical protein